MINYNDDVDYTEFAFPQTESINATSGGATDGTPYIKSVIDDLWGFNQAVMNAAGLVPDSVGEAWDASQRLKAIRNVCGAPGEIVMWIGNILPIDGSRLLELNGNGILRANYPELDEACYVGDGDNPSAPAFYRSDDALGAVRNISGVYLILPDYRGFFIRGSDPGSLIDPDGAARDAAGYGDPQLYSIGEHMHQVTTTNASGFGWNYVQLPAVANAAAGAGFSAAIGMAAPNPAWDTLITTLWPSVVEPRPVNQTAQMCVRY